MDKRARERDKEKGLPPAKRKAKGKLVEGQITTDQIQGPGPAHHRLPRPNRPLPIEPRLHRKLDRLVDKALRSGRTRRLPRSPLAGLPRRSNRLWIEGARISARPPEADDRAVPGHWEGDLVIGAGGRSALITLVERTSRFVLISRLGTRHDSATVTDALQTMVADLPWAVYSTITWDQGAQMAQHAAFTAITGIPVYFADPHSPRSASHQREHRRTDPRVLPQGHQLHRRHRRPGPGRPGPPQPPTPPGLERTDPS